MIIHSTSLHVVKAYSKRGLTPIEVKYKLLFARRRLARNMIGRYRNIVVHVTVMIWNKQETGAAVRRVQKLKFY